MSKEEESGISILGMFPKKERDLIVQYSNNIITSRLESQLSRMSNKVKLEEKTGCCRSRCICCVKVKNFVTSVYNIVQSNVGLLLLLGGYASCGALVFSYLEGPQDKFLRKQLIDTRYDFITRVEQIYNNRSLSTYGVHHSRPREGNKTLEMESVADLLQSYEKFLQDLPAQILLYESSTVMRDWSFFESLFFCGTVMTTIGYGNVTPATKYGRVATMIFGCIGIPLCLIFLSKTGKTLTKVIKFFWSFIRRFYYTGSCKRVRRMVPLSKMRMNIFQRLNSYLKKSNRSRKSWDVAQTPTFDDLEKQYPFNSSSYCGQTSNKMDDDDQDDIVPYEVDDNFNLPPIIALAIAFFYIFLGAFIYTRWENWNYLDSFYFTFISLSTIGFGDITPDHPKFFLASFIYILLGLSLIAMVINVVMEAVHETITRASDSVFNFRKRIKSAVPTMMMEVKMERRMSV